MKLVELFESQTLMELANQPYPYKLIFSDHYVTRYYFFNKDKIKFEVDFEYYGQGVFSFGFSNVGEWGGGVTTTKLTGTGDAYRVFATVLEILKDFVDSRDNISAISFESTRTEPSRVKLYTALMNKIPQYLPGWVGVRDDTLTDGTWVTFRLYPSNSARAKLLSTKDQQNANNNSSSNGKPEAS